MPGTHVNASIINGCLQQAKRDQKDCVVVFLDVSKAFDNVGHDHLCRTLKAKGVSSNMQTVIMSLITSNTTNIENCKKRSDDIDIRRGVPQDAPLSPILFNMAIDFIIDELNNTAVAESDGYRVSDELPSVSALAFADDVALVANSAESAERLTNLAITLFSSIGLSINPRKCSAINIKQGDLTSTNLKMLDGSTIACIGSHERIRYLGVTFTDEIVFDESTVGELHANLELLRASPLLKPDQKLNILNQYIFPTLIYPLQAAPLNKIKKTVLVDIDIMIRRVVKSIIGLPASTSSAMLYAPRRYRGLALLCCEWEAALQHMNIASRLRSVDDAVFHFLRDVDAEVEHCRSVLAVEGTNALSARAGLREKSYAEWCRQPWQGRGGETFKEYPPANSWVLDKSCLSSSEWTAAIKLNTNYAALRGVPGHVSRGVPSGDPTSCRRCGKDIRETPSHVVGYCPFNSLMITERHHKVKRSIRALLQERGFVCFEEVHARDGNNGDRFCDIIAFDSINKRAFIIDPTVRYEGDCDQSAQVDAEKKGIYEACIPYLKEKYCNAYADFEWEVVGLAFGSRGVIHHRVVEFFLRFGLSVSRLKQIALTVLVDTIHVLHHHIYAVKP